MTILSTNMLLSNRHRCFLLIARHTAFQVALHRIATASQISSIGQLYIQRHVNSHKCGKNAAVQSREGRREHR